MLLFLGALAWSCLLSPPRRVICLLVARQGADDVRVTWVGDRQAADPVVTTARRAQLVVVAAEMVHAHLGKHGVVLNLTLPQGGAIACNEDQFRLTLAQTLQRRRVAQGVLAALHDQTQPSIDAVEGLRRLAH